VPILDCVPFVPNDIAYRYELPAAARMTAEFIYSVLLKPKPLRLAANALIRAMLPKTVVRAGAVIHLNGKDPVVSGALALNVYEPQETSFFLSVCKPGAVFLDIGANSGYYTALFLSRAARDSRVIAIEPDPECFAFLERTVAANKRGGNATCVRVAVSDRCGAGRLYRNGANRGDNRLYNHDLATSSCEVELATVDCILARLGSPAVDLIKMDVQGLEAKVLRGMARTLARSPRLVIMSEFWPSGLRRAGDDPAAMLDLFSRHGMELFHLNGSGALTPIEDRERLVDSYRGRRYTTIVATKGVDCRRGV
jgi:FkbM family methyltransferase